LEETGAGPYKLSKFARVASKSNGDINWEKKSKSALLDEGNGSVDVEGLN
jgi:hypothetical protein